jgi:hypothetical protein
MQKVEPKMEANPNGSTCFAAYAQQHPNTICTILLLTTTLQEFVQVPTFSNAYSSELKRNLLKALYPA